MDKYDNLIFMGMNNDGKYVQDIHGEIPAMCEMIEHILTEMFKVAYFSIDTGDIDQSKHAIDLLQTIYINAVTKATKQISEGEEANAYYDI